GLVRHRLQYGPSNPVSRNGAYRPGNQAVIQRFSGWARPVPLPPVPARVRRSVRNRPPAGVLPHAPVQAATPECPGWLTPVLFANDYRASVLLDVKQGWPENQAGRPFRHGLPKDGARATAGSSTARDSANAVADRPPVHRPVATAPARQALR